MKTWIVTLIMLVACVMLSGCGEEFAAGLGTGAATMRIMSDDAQAKFIEAVNELNATTAEINAGIEGIDGAVLIKPETLTAIESLKGKEKDPTLWIALATMLLGGTGVNLYKNRTKTP